ncbi:MAG: hypothetical protein MRQ05_01975 [Candidatus Midichloria mitochondrii]|uniref:hypothetical protein n=1 Tax=Candidatus Midichloria mitochondrii TaxID=234827 RepID=UPI0002F20F7D|nr:hypothetical protein [Candidatus Midichloria mitochondrii]MDJ1298694.1 hypothetical protein [Candidatus Midichloria mitochondrii]MDJ1312886.1 hypothetical protein [Candidatus Midichloria mitochondrii]
MHSKAIDLLKDYVKKANSKSSMYQFIYQKSVSDESETSPKTAYSWPAILL